MKLTILYSGRSSKTGKEFIKKFKPLYDKVFRKRTNKRLKTDVVLRWGSTEFFSNLEGKIELNTLEAVTNASNKLKMMEILVGANIGAPKVLFRPFGQEQTSLDEFKDEDGGFYVRGSNDEVRYDNAVKHGDKYVSMPIPNKRREYRVHVFNGEVIAIYEKVPNEEGIKLFKSFNCHFKLKDMNNCNLNTTDQQKCIDAVNALGLLFGGVDMVRDKDKNTFIVEVNSAPSLNTINIDRYITKINDYVLHMLS